MLDLKEIVRAVIIQNTCVSFGNLQAVVIQRRLYEIRFFGDDLKCPVYMLKFKIGLFDEFFES